MGRNMKLILIIAVWVAPIILSASEFSVGTHKKLGREYCVSYGNPQAEINIVEYFSLSCPECIRLLKQDFPPLKEKYINSGEVFWTLHPDLLNFHW